MKSSGLASSPLFQSKFIKSKSEINFEPQSKSTMPPRNHATMVETIRKAVKEIGKEAATHRFTSAEKKALMEIIYSFNRRGIRISENEITRIAVNYLMLDYKSNGNDSILETMVESLRS